jgi:alpha-L-rhamnosidase
MLPLDGKRGISNRKQARRPEELKSKFLSLNHPMFGSVGAWFYKALAGIEQARDSVGFEKIRIVPQVVRDLPHASGSIRTVRGPVSVDWIRSDKGLLVNVFLPVNSQAEVVLPTLNLKNIVLKEGPAAIWSDQAFRPGVAGISAVKKDGPNLVVAVGSGNYSFDLSRD